MRARSSSASAARTSTPATASAAAATTRCSRWSAGRWSSPRSAVAGLSTSSRPSRRSSARRARGKQEGGPGYLARLSHAESERDIVAEFADRVTLQVQAGHGGNGCASIHREKFKPLGGPDGGNGGRGGDVIFRVDPSTATLLDFHRRPLRGAGSGKPGAGSHRSGAEGTDLIVNVPDGTVVKTRNGEVLADLIGPGTEFVAAQGGHGGLGNAALASAKRKAPGFALRGEPGEQKELLLELKTIADAGLVGFPNAGKSSLIAAMSAARPKVANYPFTTLTPHLGVVEAGDTQYVVADVPGLTPGASDGRGLGLDFLRHVERCSVLVHVIDCATEEPGRDPVTDLDVIEAELTAYDELTDAELAGRPRIVVLNKVDVPEARDLAEIGRASCRERV